jgi:hypothetical protein
VRTGSNGSSEGALAMLAPTPADGPAAGSTAASTAAYVPIAANASKIEAVLRARVRIAEICEVVTPDERSLKVPGRRSHLKAPACSRG